jgi:CRISPR-associated protein Csb2
MLALRVQYLTGRVYAAEFDDGDAKGKVEWPPHPSRLYSALVSAWAEGGAKPELIPVLEWLEESPPVLYLDADEPAPRELVNVFVPVNDSRGEESLPENRPRKGRTFPSAYLPKPEVWFVWERSMSDDQKAGLEELLRRTPSLGHSASLVGIEIANEPPDRLVRWEPGNGSGAVRLRVATPGRLKALQESYARFEKAAAKVHRPSRGATLRYRPPAACPVPQVRGVFHEMVVLRRSAGERVGLVGTLSITSALRAALLKLGPQPSPEVLSGHAPHSTPDKPIRSDRPHVALVPLAFAGGPYATGEILGIAALLPGLLSPSEREVVLKTVVKVTELSMPFGKWYLALATADEARTNLLPETWTVGTRTWATVTPYVFDRYPDDPYGAEAQEMVRRSFALVGLPLPESVSLMKTPVLTGVPTSGQFPPALSRPGKPRRFHLHAEVTFAGPVCGPVVAGAGRFYGYGLFRPVLGGGR